MTTYKVLVPIRDDKSGNAYKAGDTVTEKDFSKAVIANWLEIGVLEPKQTAVKQPPKEADKGTFHDGS